MSAGIQGKIAKCAEEQTLLRCFHVRGLCVPDAFPSASGRGFCCNLTKNVLFYRHLKSKTIGVKGMRKFLLLLASCLLLTVSVLAADSTITSMKTDCRVETDGTC